jgi:hypothetical protein
VTVVFSQVSLTAGAIAIDWHDSTVEKPGVPYERHADPFSWFVHVPPWQSRPAPELQAMVVDIRSFTGWSARLIAEAIGSTHPTVGALLEGSTGKKAMKIRDRVLAAHEVIRRVYAITNGERSRVDAVLRSKGSQGSSAVELLRREDPARAYLAALDCLRDRREERLMVGDRPRRAGEDSTPVFDED